MEYKISERNTVSPVDLDSAAELILSTQKENGEIPWFAGGKTDPWDHVESAMGLAICGHLGAAEKAYEWLVENRLKNGVWYASYKDGKPFDMTLDTNMISYVAVGVFQYFLISNDLDFLKKMWEPVEDAINFSINMQAPGGEIHWAISPEGISDSKALVTGSSSVYMSLKCALAIAKLLGKKMPKWESAIVKLGYALANCPYLFDKTKSRYSMDWFYPILSGAVTGEKARARLEKDWDKFIKNDMGVRCVSDEPWVTLAETSELVLAINSMGDRELARTIHNWLLDKVFDDGSYWCGFTFPDLVLWPEEKYTWTNGVMIMAADALYSLTPASILFSHDFWAQSSLSPMPEINMRAEDILINSLAPEDQRIPSEYN